MRFLCILSWSLGFLWSLWALKGSLASSVFDCQQSSRSIRSFYWQGLDSSFPWAWFHWMAVFLIIIKVLGLIQTWFLKNVKFFTRKAWQLIYVYVVLSLLCRASFCLLIIWLKSLHLTVISEHSFYPGPPLLFNFGNFPTLTWSSMYMTTFSYPPHFQIWTPSLFIRPSSFIRHLRLALILSSIFGMIRQKISENP